MSASDGLLIFFCGGCVFLVKNIRDGILQTGHQIPVQIHGNFDGRMAQPFRNYFGLDVSPDQHGRVGMAKIMERGFRHPGKVLRFAPGVDLPDQAEDSMCIGFAGLRISGRGYANTVRWIMTEGVGV